VGLGRRGGLGGGRVPGPVIDGACCLPVASGHPRSSICLEMGLAPVSEVRGGMPPGK
jgi:hypothetical protein